MTLHEVNNLLRSSEMLVKAGRGACNQKTYDDIASLCIPQQRIIDMEAKPNLVRNLCFEGIELSVNPFIEDGVIVPILDWSYRDCQTD